MAEQANIIFDAGSASALRDLAASLGFYIRRGPGSGEIGNIKTMLDKLAQIYQQAPEVVEAAIKLILCSKCPVHGNELALNCSFCGAWAIEATRTTVGYELFKQGTPTEEVEKRVKRQVIRVWGDGAYGQIQTSLDNGPWQGGEGVDEEGDPKDGYKLSVRMSHSRRKMEEGE